MIAPVYARVGQTITLEGYADDFGLHIVAIEFSLDGGTTWERHSTEASTPDRSVHWTFQWTPEEEGAYPLKVRSVTEDGRVSPEAAAADIVVSQ